jgi:hypothetical protein
MSPNKIKIDKALFRTMATLKANGASWDSIADKVGKPVVELEDLVWKVPRAWDKYCKRALKNAMNDAMGESVFSLRQAMRSENERIRVMASNSLVRLWNTQNPKPRLIKKAKEEVLNERQKYYRHQANCLAKMTPEKVRQIDERDAQTIFLGRLKVYLQETPELLEAVKQIADIDDYGYPKNSNGPDQCELISKNAMEHWLSKNPQLRDGKIVEQPKAIPTLSPNGPGGGPPPNLNQPKEEENKPKRELPVPEFNTFFSLLLIVCLLFSWGNTACANETVAVVEPTVLVTDSLPSSPSTCNEEVRCSSSILKEPILGSYSLPKSDSPKRVPISVSFAHSRDRP